MKNTFLALAVLALSVPAFAAKQPGGKAVLTDVSQLQWKEVGPSVSMSVVEGNPEKGASHFFLKYAQGLDAPLHHHSPDHFVTLLAGNLVLVVEGKETKLTPGSFFSLTHKAKHAAKCEQGADCVMFIDARGKWDVNFEKAAK